MIQLVVKYSNLKAKHFTCYLFLELKVNVHIGCHF